jgi:hypothetical protein
MIPESQSDIETILRILTNLNQISAFVRGIPAIIAPHPKYQ